MNEQDQVLTDIIRSMLLSNDGEHIATVQRRIFGHIEVMYSLDDIRRVARENGWLRDNDWLHHYHHIS